MPRLTSSTARRNLLVVTLLLTGCAPPAPTDSALPSAAATLVVPWPTPETVAFDPSRFGWRRVVEEVAESGETIGHSLLVGLLSEKGPTARIPLVETSWSFSLATVQVPAVAGPAGGNVLFVSDDGVSSELRVVNVDGTGNRPIGLVPQVVFVAALSPDGRTAYLNILDRTTGSDGGVIAVPTDASGGIRAVMGPATGNPGEIGGGITLAAVSRYVRSLFPSSDGHHLARLACGPTACGLDVLDLATGAVNSLGQPAILEFYGIADGIVVGLFDCRIPACGDFTRVEAVELATHIRIPVGTEVGTTVATGGDGRLILLSQSESAQGNPEPEIQGTDIRTGATHVLAATDLVVLLQPDPGLGVELPWGWHLIGICPEGCAPFALNLSDGRQVPLAGGLI